MWKEVATGILLIGATAAWRRRYLVADRLLEAMVRIKIWGVGVDSAPALVAEVLTVEQGESLSQRRPTAWQPGQAVVGAVVGAGCHPQSPPTPQLIWVTYRLGPSNTTLPQQLFMMLISSDHPQFSLPTAAPRNLLELESLEIQNKGQWYPRDDLLPLIRQLLGPLEDFHQRPPLVKQLVACDRLRISSSLFDKWEFAADEQLNLV